MPSIPAQPFVSVVIPHRGEDSSLERCLEGLRHQTYPQHLYEILIVLNEPDRRFLEFELQEGEFPLWEPQYFSYSARNHGVENSKGDVIAFTDSDTIPDQNWLQAGVDGITAGADLVAGHINLTFSEALLSPAACYEKLFAFDQEKNVRLDRASTANLLVKRELISPGSLFTNNAVSGEDFRWTSSIVAEGASLRYSREAKVSHPARESMRELLDKSRRVAAHFPRSETPRATVRRALAHYRSLYLLPPSAQKLELCSPREMIWAYLVTLVIQPWKLLSFSKALVTGGNGRSR